MFIIWSVNAVNWHNGNISEDMMTWHAIYIGNYVKKGDSKELVSGMNRNQKECLRMKTASYYGISPYNVTDG